MINHTNSSAASMHAFFILKIPVNSDVFEKIHHWHTGQCTAQLYILKPYSSMLKRCGEGGTWCNNEISIILLTKTVIMCDKALVIILITEFWQNQWPCLINS